MSALLLSHPLDTTTPAYGGGEGLRIEAMSSIAAGHTANSARYILPNHLGTHIDAPRHFFQDGPTLTHYPPEFWLFNAPLLVDVPCQDGELITPDRLPPIPPQTDLLLLRTGYEAFRDQARYHQHNPGLSAQLAHWVRATLPRVRALGLDCISVTSRHHREEGRATHRALLDPHGTGSPVLPIEDMALAGVREPLRRVVVAPLLVAKADGGPCTVLALPS